MEQSKIERINELARKARLQPLSEEEAAEQKALRLEYAAACRASLREKSAALLLPRAPSSSPRLTSTDADVPLLCDADARSRSFRALSAPPRGPARVRQRPWPPEVPLRNLKHHRAGTLRIVPDATSRHAFPSQSEPGTP